MAGGHEKPNDSNTIAMLSSTSASAVSADWECTPPLQKINVDTQYIGVIEEQQQKIKHLQEQLAEFNCVQYRMLPANTSGGGEYLTKIEEGEFDPNGPEKSANCCCPCTGSHLARKQDASKKLE
jgi:hypothetical protein